MDSVQPQEENTYGDSLSKIKFQAEAGEYANNLIQEVLAKLNPNVQAKPISDGLYKLYVLIYNYADEQCEKKREMKLNSLNLLYQELCQIFFQNENRLYADFERSPSIDGFVYFFGAYAYYARVLATLFQPQDRIRQKKRNSLACISRIIFKSTFKYDKFEFAQKQIQQRYSKMSMEFMSVLSKFLVCLETLDSDALSFSPLVQCNLCNLSYQIDKKSQNRLTELEKTLTMLIEKDQIKIDVSKISEGMLERPRMFLEMILIRFEKLQELTKLVLPELILEILKDAPTDHKLSEKCLIEKIREVKSDISEGQVRKEIEMLLQAKDETLRLEQDAKGEKFYQYVE